jgi:tetratricopeptide (TPR) repeat protein
MSAEELLVHLRQRLEIARYLRNTRQPEQATPILVELLDDRSPEPLQQTALLELAAAAQDENDLARAQQIYTQFLNKWPNDLRTPEILLRQGLLFRQMGLYNLAFTKLYGVMTSALVLKNDQLDYYVRLVLQAQTEIAATQYELGKYADASELFSRLLKQNNPSINKSQIVYKLLRCHTALARYAETVTEAEDYLAQFPDAPEQPEIRFYLALALKELRRNSESLQQVLLLLQEQRNRTKGRPELWAYWQQRAGNLIANQLYQEGDYTKALEVYLRLAQLDLSPQWQAAVLYQIGVTYERLWQPQKAAETYNAILGREKQLGTNTPPDLKTVFDMTRWRVGFLQWQNQAETANRQLRVANATNASVTASLLGTVTPTP